MAPINRIGTFIEINKHCFRLCSMGWTSRISTYVGCDSTSGSFTKSQSCSTRRWQRTSNMAEMVFPVTTSRELRARQTLTTSSWHCLKYVCAQISNKTIFMTYTREKNQNGSFFITDLFSKLRLVSPPAIDLSLRFCLFPLISGSQTGVRLSPGVHEGVADSMNMLPS